MHKSIYTSSIFVPFSKMFRRQVWLDDDFCYFRPSGPFRFMGPLTLNSSERHCFAGFRQYEITLEKRSPEDRDGFRYRCHINTRVAYSSISPVGFPIEVIEILMGKRRPKKFFTPMETLFHCYPLPLSIFFLFSLSIHSIYPFFLLYFSSRVLMTLRS